MTRRVRHIIPAMVAVALALGFAAGSVAAQEPQASPGATPAAAVPHPVAVHEGTCQSPTAEPAFDIGETAPFGEQAEEPQDLGVTEQPRVLYASSEIDMSMDDLTGSPHVIAIHQSDDQFGTLMVCGEIAGTADGGRLAIALYPATGQSHAGVAILEEDDDVVQAEVFLIPSAATPMATPEA